MPGRTFAIGDIHGDVDALYRLLACFPELDAERHHRLRRRLRRPRPQVEGGRRLRARRCPSRRRRRSSRCAATTRTRGCASSTAAGPSSSLPRRNGCLATLRSFTGGAAARGGRAARRPTSCAAILNGHVLPARRRRVDARRCRSSTRTSTPSTCTPGLPARRRAASCTRREVKHAGRAPLVPRRRLLPPTTAASSSSSATPRPSCSRPSSRRYTPEDPDRHLGGPVHASASTPAAARAASSPRSSCPSLRVYESR